jgi:sugar phosphate isomerase/epimerase
MSNSGPVLGVTLFSFTNEWQQRLYTLEQMITKVAELGLGPGIEVVGFQSFRSFPDVPDDEARHFRALLDKYGLVPTCLGANIDLGRRRDRLMTDDEIYDTVRRQLISTKKLGFPVVRVQASAGVRTLEKVLPLAEEYQIQLAVELHSPLSIYHPEVVEMRSAFDRLSSPYLGFIPDFSTTMISVPEGYWAGLRKSGAPEGLIDAAKEIWKTNDPIPAKFGALAEAGRSFNANPAVSGSINLVMTMFGHAPVESWSEILPYARHIHGKYYEVTAEGVEPSIPYAELMALLKRHGYQGTISAEWEGQAFTEEAIGFQQVAAWNAMCKRLLGR